MVAVGASPYSAVQSPAQRQFWEPLQQLLWPAGAAFSSVGFLLSLWSAGRYELRFPCVGSASVCWQGVSRFLLHCVQPQLSNEQVCMCTPMLLNGSIISWMLGRRSQEGSITESRPGRADLKCWAFCPPGGLVSDSLLPALSEWCVSVVCGKDAVPRMTVNNLARLMDEMVTALARTRCAAPCQPHPWCFICLAVWKGAFWACKGAWMML